jgi:hypothetical protein
MRDEEKTINGPYHADSSEIAISRLLGALTRVDAPADFQIHVRSRITEREPRALPGFQLPRALRYLTGVAAVVAIAGVFGYVWLNSGQRLEDVPVAVVDSPDRQPQTAAPADTKTLPPANIVSDEKAAVSSPVTAGPARRQLRIQETTGSSTNEDTGPVGSSRTLAERESRKVYPKGVDPDHARLPKPREFAGGSHIKASDVLSLLGIHALFTGSGWRVDSVSVNTTAERVGIIVGDVIEAINDQPLDERTSFSGNFTGRSLTIVRDGRVQRIFLAGK